MPTPCNFQRRGTVRAKWMPSSRHSRRAGAMPRRARRCCGREIRLRSYPVASRACSRQRVATWAAGTKRPSWFAATRTHGRNTRGWIAPPNFRNLASAWH